MVGLALHQHLHLSLPHHMSPITQTSGAAGMTIGIGMAGIPINRDGGAGSMIRIPALMGLSWLVGSHHWGIGNHR